MPYLLSDEIKPLTDEDLKASEDAAKKAVFDKAKAAFEASKTSSKPVVLPYTEYVNVVAKRTKTVPMWAMFAIIGVLGITVFKLSEE